MRKLYYSVAVAFLALALAVERPILADTLTLLGDNSVDGTVLQTNSDNILFLTDYGTLNYSSRLVKKITIDPSTSPKSKAAVGIPDSKAIILALNHQPWASNLKQIPATVIDKGILKNVPYISFRCGGNYEVNIYGDLDHPAGVEVGVYRDLVASADAQRNCASFAKVVFGKQPNSSVIDVLDLKKDLKTDGNLTYEVTPPSDEDSYGGWWISIYSVQRLNFSRATDDEMNLITSMIVATNRSSIEPSWTSDELKLARPATTYPTNITFVDSDGKTVTDAEVVRVIDGVALIWRQGASGGLLKLANLGDNLQKKFGYDPAKAAKAEAAEQERKAREAALQAQAARISGDADPVPRFCFG